MFKKLIAITVCVSFLSCATNSGHPDKSARMLTQLCDDYWEYQMEANPGWATYLGDRRYEDRLGEIDAASRKKAKRATEEFLTRIRAIDRTGLKDTDLVTADVLEQVLVRRLEGMEWRAYQWEIDQMSGPQVWLYESVNSHKMDEKGHRTFIAKIQAFGPYMVDYLANLDEGLRVNNVAPKVAVKRVIAQLEAILATTPEKCPLLEAVDKMPEDLRATHGEDFRKMLLAAVSDFVYPAYTKMHYFLTRKYLAKARDEVGVGWNEFGQKAYQHQIWHHTSLRFTAKELHETGLEVLKGLHTRMLEIARKRGHEGDTKSFIEKLRQDKSQFYSSREEVIRDAEACLKRAKDILPSMFGRLPTRDCIVKAMEEYREADAPAAYYYGPRGPDAKTGTYYINTYKPQERPKYNMPALSAHEAVPGHHLQIALAREMTDLPKFRRHMGVTAFVEGWALYSELLGEETGFYRNDLEIFGMLTYQAWRAARLVVDTGMHAFGWSREKAVRFMLDNVALSEKNANNEIDRYIIWPGQALAYMVGRLHIQKLRARAEKELGDAFDIRSFHDEVLKNGGIPLPVLDKVIDRWIERNR